MNKRQTVILTAVMLMTGTAGSANSYTNRPTQTTDNAQTAVADSCLSVD